jgi:hypothetical protein
MPPRILSKSPSPGPIGSLKQLTLTFTKPVQGVDASDLLINGVVATNVTGSADNYIFRFPEPAYGVVAVTWASGHAITDTLFPPAPFNGNDPEATWQYELISPPKITTIHITNDVVTVGWESFPGAHYRVETASSLPVLNWTPLSDVVVSSETLTTYSTVFDTEPQRFYHVVLVEN